MLVRSTRKYAGYTDILLLFIDVADLEPDVFLVKWTWWIVDDVFEAL